MYTQTGNNNKKNGQKGPAAKQCKEEELLLWCNSGRKLLPLGNEGAGDMLCKMTGKTSQSVRSYKFGEREAETKTERMRRRKGASRGALAELSVAFL